MTKNCRNMSHPVEKKVHSQETSLSLGKVAMNCVLDSSMRSWQNTQFKVTTYARLSVQNPKMILNFSQYIRPPKMFTFYMNFMNQKFHKMTLGKYCGETNAKRKVGICNTGMWPQEIIITKKKTLKFLRGWKGCFKLLKTL